MRTALLALLAIALLLALAVPVGLLFGVRSEVGSIWLLGRLPGLSITKPRGSLVGNFSAERVELKIDGSGRLILFDPAWKSLRVSRSLLDGHWIAVDIESLGARAAEWIPDESPKPDRRLTAPADLKLPLSLKIGTLAIGEFRTAALAGQPLRDLRGRIELSAESGAQHHIRIDNLERDRLRINGALQIGTDGEMKLDGRFGFGPSTAAIAAPAAPGPLGDWSARLSVNGPLMKPTVAADASASGKRLLQLDAVLQPFEPWPLADLQARTDDLDLALFSSAAPKTALTGSAQVETAGLDKPARVDIRLNNREAGLWNARRLPLRELKLDLQARPDAPQLASIRSFVAELGSASQPAGRLSGSGEFDRGKFSVNLVLEELLPARLDTRAPVMSLSGPLKASGQLPASSAASPTSAARPLEVTAISSLKGSIEIPSEATDDGKATPRKRQRVAAVPLRQRLAIDVDAALRSDPGGVFQLALKRFDVTAGDAGLKVEGTMARVSTDAPMAIDAALQMSEFDPRPWLPSSGEDDWRRGRTRLNARSKVDLQLLPPSTSGTTDVRPTDAAAQALAAIHRTMASLRGTATLALQPSHFAGIAFEGQGKLKVDGASPGAGIGSAELALRSRANRLEATLRTRADQPAADRIELRIDAPALDELTAAASLLGLPTPTTPRAGPATEQRRLAGSIVGNAVVEGRWPSLRSDGRLTTRGLQLPGLALQRGAIDWKLATSLDAPVALAADLAGMVVADASVERATLKLSGSARSHRIELDAHSSALPPAWTDRLSGANGRAPAAKSAALPTDGPSPTMASLRASGGLIAAVGGGARSAVPSASGWKGRIDELRLRSGANPQATIALRGNDLDLAARWAGAAPALSVSPGRIELQAGPTVAALRWSRLELQAGVAAASDRPVAAPKIDIEAELEPIAVAPLLARLQPDFGWGGDLRMGGKFSVQTTPALRADVVVDRRSGDLSVTDESGVRSLGLSDLRLALNARDGVWNLTQALAGSTLGVAAGAIVARTGSATAWPDARTPIQGVIELQVEKLGTWGPWVPAGWRLDGHLQTSASFGGRIGAPEITGKLRGTGLGIRNFVEGVNVTDGEVAVTLAGETARIESFTARAGGGTVSITGNASLGEAPKADLQLQAERFQLLGRVDRRIVASGQGRLRLGVERIALDGKFTVDEGLIDFTRGGAPGLSDDVIVTRAERGPDGKVIEVKSRSGDQPPPKPAPRKQSAAARALALDLRVDLGNKLRLKGRGLDTGLRGELHITSPGGNLAVNGTVLAADGIFKAYGQNLKIERGAVVFVGPVDNPRLDIEAVRGNSGNDVRVGVRVAGNVSNLRVRLFSEPEMSEVDKLSMLVLGRATEGVGRAETALLQRAAFALLAGNGESASDRVSQALGLDEISLRQTDGEVKETVVSVGKQISDQVYVGYERGLNATAGSWQLIYRIAQRFTLRAQAGYENSIDLIWTWRWR